MHLSGFKIAILAIGGTALAAAAISCISVSIANHDRVILGVQTADMTLSGMSAAQVHDYFEKKAAFQLKDGAIHLSCEQQKWVLQPEDIGLVAHVDEAAAAAYRIGHSGDFLQDLAVQLRCAVFGYRITLDAGYDQSLLLARLKEIAASIERQPANAYCTVSETGLIQKFPAVIGQKLDILPIADELDPKLVSLRLPARVELQPSKEFPAVRDEDIAAIDHVLSTYSTRYFPGDRGDNIAIAAAHLSHVLVKASGTFSFNDTVGPRTAAAGYKDAGVIIDGQLAQDIGGGVCQVSSTLYNAVLLAGLTPTSRTAHFYPSAYCPPGLDATVADGLIDFQFQNRLPHNVYMLAAASEGILTLYILGTLADLKGNSIALASEGTRLQPSIYRLYIHNGQLIEKEFLHTDHYSVPQETGRQ